MNFAFIPHRHAAWVGSLGALTLACAGCASAPAMPEPARPFVAAPVARPATLERVNTGSIYQPGMATGLFAGRAKPRRVGDTLKVDISEAMSATQSVTTNASRDSSLASKGPGTSETGIGILKGLLNLDASASGSDTYKGSGTAGNSSKFTGQIAAMVINVYGNGNLLVAGERSIGLNGGQTVLRFSGIVDPRDVRDGVVTSADVVNARYEIAGAGDVSDAASRSWLQRVLANALRVW